MFEKMATRGGGTIIIIFEDETMEEKFKKQFKTEEDFLKDIPDEFNESSEELSFYVPNPMSIVNSLFTKPMTKFSSPTEKQFSVYMQDTIYS